VWTVRDNANLSSARHPRARPHNLTTSTAVNAAWAAPVRSAWTVWAPVVATSCAPAPCTAAATPQTVKLPAQHDRFSLRDGLYFNVVQPYQHRTFRRWHQRLLVRAQAGPPAFRLVQHVAY
jgi:hypothetical protein